MAKKLKLFLAAFIAVLTFGFVAHLFGSPVFADEEKSEITLQVSPVKQKISLTPGSSYSGTFKVQNVGNVAFNYTTSATPYSVVDESYNPNYESIATYTQMAEWITIDKKTGSGTLQPGETVDVTYTVNVPNDVPAGGQYAVLMAQTESGNADNATVAVIRRVGMILYATVPGETRAEGEIVKNTVNSFYFNPPLTVSSLVKNTGNIEQSATYTVRIYPLFSKEAVFSNEDEPSVKDIYPETSRFNSITWEGAPQIGIFNVEQKIEFAGQISTVNKLVLICPLWLLFIIFALLFMMIFWLVSRARNRKNEAARAAGRVEQKAPKQTEKAKSTKSEKEEK